MKRQYRTGGILLAASLLGVTTSASGMSTHIDKALGIYNIEAYQTQFDTRLNTNPTWKTTITTSGNQDAYDAFWTAMTSCSTNECASTLSHRYTDGSTTVNTMLGSTGWLAHDMVFFFGHNVSMREWNDDGLSFDAWVPWNTATSQAQLYYTGNWTQISLCPGCPYKMADWGTGVIPFYYHQRGTYAGAQGIQDSQWTSPAYSVFYGYTPLSSILIGQDFKTGTWLSESAVNQSTATARSGQLGGELEYLIANGCEAVPVARIINHTLGNGIEISDQARVAWKPSWRGLHSAMGHYFLTTTGAVPNLTNFANDLKAGVGVGRAYFNAHTCNFPGQPGMCQPGHLAPRDGGTFDNDKWTAQTADPTTTDEAGTWYATYWVGG